MYILVVLSFSLVISAIPTSQEGNHENGEIMNSSQSQRHQSHKSPFSCTTSDLASTPLSSESTSLVEVPLQSDFNTVEDGKLDRRDFTRSEFDEQAANETIFRPDFDFARDGHRILQLTSEHGSSKVVSHLLLMLKNPGNKTDLEMYLSDRPFVTNSAQDLERCKFNSSLIVSYRLAAMNKHVMICQMLYQLGILTVPDVIAVTAENGLDSMVKHILFTDQKPPKSPLSKLLFGIHEYPEFDEAIFKAASNGHDESLKMLLLDNRGNPFVRQNEALIAAASKGHLKCVELLLNAPKAATLIKADDLHRAFYIASANNHVQVSKLLYESRGIKGDLKACLVIGQTMEQVAQSGHVDIVKLLLHDPCLENLVLYWNAVMKSCKSGQSEILNTLVPEISMLKPDSRSKLLLAAVESGHASIVEILVQNNTVEAFGNDIEALRAAVKGNNREISKILLRHYNPLSPGQGVSDDEEVEGQEKEDQDMENQDMENQDTENQVQEAEQLNHSSSTSII